MPLQFIDLLIFSFGFLAQFLFFSRNIGQWFKSEKAGKVLSPVLHWQISLIASVAMMVYLPHRTGYYPTRFHAIESHWQLNTIQ